MGQSSWKTVQRYFKTLKIALLSDPATLLLGIYSKEFKAASQRDVCTPMFIAALFTVGKRWKQPKYPSTGEWIKMWHIYIMEY